MHSEIMIKLHGRGKKSGLCLKYDMRPLRPSNQVSHMLPSYVLEISIYLNFGIIS